MKRKRRKKKKVKLCCLLIFLSLLLLLFVLYCICWSIIAPFPSKQQQQPKINEYDDDKQENLENSNSNDNDALTLQLLRGDGDGTRTIKRPNNNNILSPQEQKIERNEFDDTQQRTEGNNSILSLQLLRGGDRTRVNRPNKKKILHHEREDDNKPQRIYKSSLSHCNNNTTIREIVLKGERHSGTKWVENIIGLNIPHMFNTTRLVRDSPRMGWKHGFLPPLGWGEPLSSHVILVVITRDVFTWLPKMYNQTYDRYMNEKRQNLNFSEFIRTPYVAQCHPTPGEGHGGLETRRGAMMEKKRSKKYPQKDLFCKSHNTDEEKYDPETVIAERADNIIQIRTQKYKQWLSSSNNNDNTTTKRIYLRLETLTTPEQQERLIIQPLYQQCITVYEDFQGIPPTLKQHEKEEELLQLYYTPEDIQFVLDQVDLDLERQIGYNYSRIFERIKNK